MLVRDRMKLDRLGMIPEFMRDTWQKKFGETYPTRETPKMERWVHFDAWVNRFLPLMTKFLLVACIVSTLVTIFKGWSGTVFGWSIGLFVLALIAKVLPVLVTHVVQRNTQSNTFNRKFGCALQWMKLGPQDLGRFSASELKKLADEALIQKARRIICLEKRVRMFQGLGSDEELKDLRLEMKTMSDVFGELGLTDTPWGPIFSEAGKLVSSHKREEQRQE